MKRFSLHSLYVLAILLAVACGKDNGANNNGASGTPGAPGSSGGPESAQITRYDQITAARNREDLVGKTVDLDNVPVVRVVGTNTFWIGDPDSGVPVVRQDRINGPVTSHVRAGGHARLVGTVRLVSSAEANDPMWEKINANGRRDIENQRIFIRANRVDPLP